MRPAAATDDPFTIGVRVTSEQLRGISRRAGLGPFDGLARSEYIVGCVLNEPQEQLLERVREIRDAERARFRAEREAERARR